VRRIVATMLVVASPLLLATPVSAGEAPLRAQGAAQAVLPAAPAPVQSVTPAVPYPAPATVAAPALPAPSVAAPALATPAAPTPVRHVVKAVRPKAPAAVTDLSDAAYAARLQAELCQARQIFCGLDRNGRYPAR
jgi:hypothetical protein